jgi:hypothetical protein
VFAHDGGVLWAQSGGGGPTPLRIVADPSGSAQLAGTPTGTAPGRKHDASFYLETEVFDHPFTLHVPVVVKAASGAGSDDIALSVWFQACNDHVCPPPRTIHLTVPVKSASGAR